MPANDLFGHSSVFSIGQSIYLVNLMCITYKVVFKMEILISIIKENDILEAVHYLLSKYRRLNQKKFFVGLQRTGNSGKNWLQTWFNNHVSSYGLSKYSYTRI